MIWGKKMGPSAAHKNLHEHRLDTLESRLNTIDEKLDKLVKAETIERAFKRLEAVEQGVVGTPSEPGIKAHQLILEAKLEANTFLTRLIVGFMLGQFITAVALGLYVMMALRNGVTP